MADPKKAGASETTPAPDASLAAVIVEAEGLTSCRPPPGKRLEVLGEVVIGNWIGRWKGSRATVLHGTPLLGLHPDLVAAIRGTKDQHIGVIAPPPEPATMIQVPR